MERCDDIHDIFAVDQHSQYDYTANWYKVGNFFNSIATLWLSLSAPTNASGQAFRGQSQTNVHSMVPYDDIDNNNDNKFDGPAWVQLLLSQHWSYFWFLQIFNVSGLQ